ncbi:transposase, partial [Dysgonomonas sp. 511]|uniref:IS66 family transposase n=1 Tax=Dysgonomonas sp. 511 TaxID=2302930 RepID=UPI0013D1695D
ISKYQDHQPYYRQLEMFKRSGVHLAASTVNDWSASAINLLEPLYQQLKKDVLGSDYIQVDETTIPVLDKDKPGATRKGYHWVVRSPENGQLFFHYDKGSRAGHVVVD